VLEIVIALGILSIVALALIITMISGIRASAQARRVSQGTHLAHQCMERIRTNLKVGGSSYLPAGTYKFDGQLPDPPVGTAPLTFPPSPYPTYQLDQQDYRVVIYGSELSPKLRQVSVEVLWGPSGHAALETHFHL
jgi:type II secretory pathway pseudopilin PulG